MDIPMDFYHTTSAAKEALVKEDNVLKPQVHSPPSEWMWLVKNPDHRNLVPNGVWFCATLYNGNLPPQSPYGNRRVRIPIADVIQQLGGYVRLYAGVTNQRVGNNTYVRLMLVKGDASHATFPILQHMKELDIANNPWFTIRIQDGYRVACRPTWVEIYVPYPIDVSRPNCVWDEVQHK